MSGPTASRSARSSSAATPSWTATTATPRRPRSHDPRRLAAHRRHGHDRRGRLRPHQGPLQGHHHQLRARTSHRSRSRSRSARTRMSWSARSWPPRTRSEARSRSRSSSSSRTRRSRAKELRAFLPGAAGSPQGPARDPVPGRASQGRHGQDPQGRAARAILGRTRSARPLTRPDEVPAGQQTGGGATTITNEDAARDALVERLFEAALGN